MVTIHVTSTMSESGRVNARGKGLRSLTVLRR